MTCMAAARAYGIAILDGVYNDISNAEGFRQECLEGRDLGFDGKTLIHPNQIGPCNEVFSPSAEEVAQARKIIAAFDQPENQRQGRDLARRPHGRAHACRHREKDRGDRGRDRGAEGLRLPMHARAWRAHRPWSEVMDCRVRRLRCAPGIARKETKRHSGIV